MTPAPLACTGKLCPPDRLAVDGTMLCHDCTRRLERQLAEMPARIHLVQALHDGQQTPRRSDRPVFRGRGSILYSVRVFAAAEMMNVATRPAIATPPPTSKSK